MAITIRTPFYYRLVTIIFIVVATAITVAYVYACLFEKEASIAMHLVVWIMLSCLIGLAAALLLNCWYTITITAHSITVQKPFNRLQIPSADWAMAEITDNRQIFKTSQSKIMVSLFPGDLLQLRKYLPVVFQPLDIKLPYRLKLNRALNVISFVVATASGIGLIASLASDFTSIYNFEKGAIILLSVMFFAIALFIRSVLLLEIEFDKGFVSISYFLRTYTYVNPVFENLGVRTDVHYSFESGKTEQNKLVFTLEGKEFSLLSISTKVSLLQLEQFIKTNYPNTPLENTYSTTFYSK